MMSIHDYTPANDKYTHLHDCRQPLPAFGIMQYVLDCMHTTMAGHGMPRCPAALNAATRTAISVGGYSAQVLMA